MKMYKKIKIGILEIDTFSAKTFKILPKYNDFEAENLHI